MRTAYLGTADFAAGVLRVLADSPHRPALVVTRPDRPAGRGQRLTSPPVADTAREFGLEVFQPDDVNAEESRARIAAAEPEVLVVCAFGALVKQGLLDEHLILNVHPSLLPRWRGAAPIERAIMAGDDRTGVAIMQLEAGLDSGPVYAVEETPIEPDDTFGTLSARLLGIGARLLVGVLDAIPEPVAQPEDGVTYAEKIAAADRTVDPRDPETAARTVRALSPHIGARQQLDDGSFLGIREARVVDGALEPVVVQPPGGRPMPYADYLRGRSPAR